MGLHENFFVIMYFEIEMFCRVFPCQKIYNFLSSRALDCSFLNDVADDIFILSSDPFFGYLNNQG